MIQSQTFPLMMLVLVQLIFGFNFAASKVILEEYPPLLWGGIRLFLSALLMFSVSFFFVPKNERVLNRSFLVHCLWYSFFGIGLNQAFFLLGLFSTTTTNSAILNSTTPIFALLIAILMGKEKFTLFRGVGFLISFFGVLVLRKIEDFSLSDETLKGDLFTVLNCLSLALFFNLSRDFLRKHSAFWATAWMFLFGAGMLLLISLPSAERLLPAVWTPSLLWAIFYNVVLATMVTYFLNSWTLKKVDPSKVALFIYLQPVIAVVYEWAIHGLVPESRTIQSVAMIFFGVLIGLKK